MSNFQGFGVLEISGEVEPQLSSSLDVSGNLNVRHSLERKQYDRLIRGEALRKDLGEAPQTYVADLDPPFTVSSSIASYPVQLATPPSWTQLGVREAHGFVMPALSSSDHEVSRLNAFSSGVLSLEESPVPASGTAYYSKSSRLVTLSYKLSASIDLPVFPGNLEQFPHEAEQGPRSVFVAASGSYRNYTYWRPAEFEIDIPDYGKIRDIKVWVEFVHDIRTHTGSFGGTGGDSTHPNNTFPGQGLQSLQISLRSPNVQFRSAHPLWNDPTARQYLLRPFHRDASGFRSLTGSANQFGDFYNRVPELLHSSYLLWQGHLLDVDDILTTGDFDWDFAPHYSEADSDIDMRTIFYDGSNVRNPRHLDGLYEDPSVVAGPGKSTGSILGSFFSTISAFGDAERSDDPGDFVTPYVRLNRLGALIGSGSGFFAPTTGSEQGFNFDVPPNDNTRSGVGGNNCPWFHDPRITPGLMLNTSSFAEFFGTSPPKGWLTGPGGTAGDGEFPTTGSQIGPSHMKPVYPLLDDVFVEKFYFDTDLYDPTSDAEIDLVSTVLLSPEFLSTRKYSGFRPGLRGTEIHGKWKLLMGMMTSVDISGSSFMTTFQNNGEPIFDPAGIDNGFIAHPRAGVWFRQFRLEFIVDQGSGVESFYSSKERRFKKSGYVPLPPGERRRINVISGSSNFDLGVNYIFTGGQQEYGRTVGITDNTGSAIDSFAVFSRITGSLVSRITGTLVPFFYLNNEFGTPFIPLSSGSALDPDFQTLDPDAASMSQLFKDSVLFPKNKFVSDQTIKATLNNSDYYQTTAEKAAAALEAIISGSGV